MSKRDIVLSILNHEENIIPSWTMAFFNIQTARRLLGEENVVKDSMPPENYLFGAATKDNRERNLRFSEAVDNFAIGVGKNANFAFGHGGPGEFTDRIIEKGTNYYISQYETGVKKKVTINPHFYNHFDYPLDSLEKVREVFVPDAFDDRRYDGINEEVQYYRQKGYFTFANINGFFSGLHYYFYPYDKLFIDMMLDKDNLKILIKKLAEFNLTAAEKLLRTGVDCIAFCDDLGDGRSLLFSPDLYKELFLSYHCELAGLCHSYGAYSHMHSHGNISKVFPMIVEAGIDMINPCDPYEFKDLLSLKEEFGSRITLVGGLDKFFFEWGYPEMKDFLFHLIKTGKKHGGFILMDSGGIPESITNEKYNYYREISREYRYGN
jgi:uroporphyrinogen decarboxylase